MNATRAILLVAIVFIGVRAEDMPSTTNHPDPKQVELLRNRAAEFYNRADYPSALEAMKRALKAAEAAWGEQNTNVTEILELTAGVYRTQGDHANALALCKRSLGIREKALGSEHPDVATSLFALASLYNDLGDYAQGLQMGKRSLQIREKAFGREHQDVAASLAILSKIYVHQGDYRQALETLDRAFAYWDKHFEVNPGLAVTCLLDMASINQHLGNYDSSLRLYKAVLMLYEKLYGQEHPFVAACLNNIASIYEEQMNYAEALSFYQRSLTLELKLLGPEHPDVGLGLNNSGKTLAELGRYPEAMKLYQRALPILEKALGDTHPNVAVILNNIAHVYQEQADHSNALLALERSLAINLKAFGNEHPRVASVLNGLASVCKSQGKLSEALTFYERSLVIKEKALGPDHPEVVSGLRNIAVLWMEQKNIKDALKVHAEAFRRRRSYFVLQFSGGTDKEAMRLVEYDRFSEELFHSLCGSSALNDAGTVLGAAELALNKAMLEEFRATQAALESATDTATQELREQRQVALFRLERLAKNQLGPKQQAEARREIEAEVKIIDDKLSERAPLAVLSLRDRIVTTSEVAHSLPPDSVLVDLVQFRRFDSIAKTNWWKEQRYAAYLTFPLEKNATNIVVKRVDLGEATPINEAIETVSRRMSAGQFRAGDLAVALQRVSELLYAPLGRHLTNVSHLIICPDGQLSRVPFEMLPLPPFGAQPRYLIEDKTVSYVGSGREIVRLAQPVSKGKTNAPVVMGNPDFGLDLKGGAVTAATRNSTSENEVTLVSQATRSVSRSYRGIRFNPLPGSEQEAVSVARLLGSDCVLRLGKDAREADLKALVSPRVLHLATHGFFLTDQEFKHTNATLKPLPLSENFSARRFPAEDDWENPMLRCGIALAGANHATRITNAVAEDGLLTGLEAAILNLQGTELVILSACDTGTGDIKIGEGVMSLRRAFRIAGAQTVLASHWKVSDKATSQLMTEFMRGWRAGKPRIDAWREAQLAMLRSPEFSNPFYWAAFTLTGQWR